MTDLAATVKACCAAAYGADVVGLFLDESFHPGGVALTRRLADALGLEKGERVLDVAAGIGTTALLLAEERHVDVVGIDLGESQVAQARARAERAGVAAAGPGAPGGASPGGPAGGARPGGPASGTVFGGGAGPDAAGETRPSAVAGHGGGTGSGDVAVAGGSGGGRVCFEVGDAERLPFENGAFDAAVCECAFCTFPDKATAATELARVLRPGGRVGLTDIWLDPNRLDPELRGLAGRIACLADARPIDELQAILEGAGFEVELIERHDRALADMIERVETRLRALRLVDLPELRPFNLRRGIELARRASAAVALGDAGYLLLVATKR